MADILVPLGFFALIFGAFYLKYRRDMAMIERGMDPNMPWLRRRYGMGMPTSSMGEPLSPQDAGLAYAEYRAMRLERALTLTGIGLALTIGMSFMGFGPWMLGGLIPLFLGLSRLLGVLLTPDKQAAPTVYQQATHTDIPEGKA